MNTVLLVAAKRSHSAGASYDILSIRGLNMMRLSCLHSAKYFLGEVEHQYDDVDVFHSVLAEYGLPNMPKLFAWGGYRTSAKTIFEMAFESMQQTLAGAPIEPQEVDLVIICSSDFSPVDETLSYSQLLLSLGMERAFPMGVTVSDCANLLSVLDMAKQFIESGKYQHILLVTSNKIRDERHRFQDYALFSDGAASFMVSDKKALSEVPEDGLNIVDSQVNAHLQLKVAGEDIDDTPLFTTTAQQLMDRNHLTIRDLSKVFSNNLYMPVITLKEGSIGVSKTQLYLDNIARFGHCFSADSIINLVDYMACSTAAHGEYFALHSSASGLRAQVLLQACRD
ncbi:MULTISPECIES: hypothetical protein [Pseudoalteromonas]|nr:MULTISPECIES: hypothetical protein [Pseudoalteromonas]KZN29891.1 hypothetical protein N483_06380 [Pseudoalteromonas luteoviolacea NCIMB 1944]MCG7550585.1 hypothetical protein [Pseudoalteromonas sp. Of7M-16]